MRNCRPSLPPRTIPPAPRLAANSPSKDAASRVSIKARAEARFLVSSSVATGADEQLRGKDDDYTFQIFKPDDYRDGAFQPWFPADYPARRGFDSRFCPRLDPRSAASPGKRRDRKGPGGR